MTKLTGLLRKHIAKNVKLYILIYKFHRFLKNNVFNTDKFISWVIAIFFLLSPLISIRRNGPNDKTEFSEIFKLENLNPIILYIVFLILYFITNKIIQAVIKNTGVLKRFTMPGRYLIRHGKGKPCELNLEDIDEQLYLFATENMAALSAELNLKGYSNGLWHTNYEEKLKRNLGHIKKNKHSIMFFRFERGEEIIGFSHILPVSLDTWNSYMKGKIKDNEFGEDLVCPDIPKFKNDMPYGFILFSLVCTKINEVQYFLQNKEYHNYLGDFLEKVKVYHLKALLSKHFGLDGVNNYSKVNVLLQNEDELCYKTFFKNCSDMSAVSGDNSTIIHFTIANK